MFRGAAGMNTTASNMTGATGNTTGLNMTGAKKMFLNTSH
jgi:hypothetical protein